MKLPKKRPPNTDKPRISVLCFCSDGLWKPGRFDNTELDVSERLPNKQTNRYAFTEFAFGKPAVSRPRSAHLGWAGVSPRRLPTAPFPGRRHGSKTLRNPGSPRQRPARRGTVRANDSHRPAGETPAQARRRADRPAERGAALGNSPPGVAAGGGRAALSPRGLVLNPLRGRGRCRRRQVGAPQIWSTVVPRHPLRLAGRAAGTQPASLAYHSQAPGARLSQLCADPRARAGARGARGPGDARGRGWRRPRRPASASTALMAATSFLPRVPLLDTALPRTENAGS